MSWWDTGNGDDVIGDQSGDLARHGLLAIVDANARHGRPKPLLQDLLRAIAAVAIQAPPSQLTRPARLGEIVASLETGDVLSSGPVHDEADVAQELTSPLKANLRQLADVYQQRWKRPPRLSEWLESLAFVLRSQPEKYLLDGVEHSPESIDSRG